MAVSSFHFKKKFVFQVSKIQNTEQLVVKYSLRIKKVLAIGLHLCNILVIVTMYAIVENLSDDYLIYLCSYYLLLYPNACQLNSLLLL